jgi:hypothetical protein
MKHVGAVLALVCASGLLAGCASEPAAVPLASAPVRYSVDVHEFEGCECNPVCPCVFSSDTTFGDCRGLTVFTFVQGTYGTTVLKDVPCVVAITWAGRNMEDNLGDWRGVLYLPDTATPAEREAVRGLVHAMLGDAFAALDERTAPIRIERRGDVHDLTVGTVARLRIHGTRGPDGEATRILSAPSPLAYPVMFCALADVHTYDDGQASWSFTGRNGFYADFHLSGAQ